MKESNWKCLGEKSSGIICPLKGMCKRNQFTMEQAHLFITADFNSEDECENFLEDEKEDEISIKTLHMMDEAVKNIKNNKNKKDIK
jgi:hypothetical protein